MWDHEPDWWLEDSCREVAKGIRDSLNDKTTRFLMRREALAMRRKGGTCYATDSLIGFLNALMRQLWILNVRPDLLKYGEVAYDSRYLEGKLWDYLLENPAGQPVVRIEMKCFRGPGRPYGTSGDIVGQFAQLLGMLYDHKVSIKGCFTGVVLVDRLPPSREWGCCEDAVALQRRKRFATYIERIRADGLVDEAMYVEARGNGMRSPLPAASIASFMLALRERLWQDPTLFRRIDIYARPAICSRPTGPAPAADAENATAADGAGADPASVAWPNAPAGA